MNHLIAVMFQALVRSGFPGGSVAMNRYGGRIRAFLAVVLFILAIPVSPALAGGPGSITLSPATSRIVASEENRELAEWLAKEIASAAAVRVPIISDDRVDESTWRSYHLIVIGNLNDNQATARLYYDYKAFLDAAFPGQGGLMVKTLVNPLGYGKKRDSGGWKQQSGYQRSGPTVWVAGVRARGRVGAAACGRLPVSSGTVSVDEEVEEILEENRRSLKTGSFRGSNTIGFGLNFHFTADPVWAHLFKGHFSTTSLLRDKRVTGILTP